MKAEIKQFIDLLEYQAWVNERMNNLSKENELLTEYFDKTETENRINKRGGKWFGEGATYRELAAGVSQYKNPDLITKIYNQVNHSISTQARDSIKARKVKFNPFGLGIFVFDRAAMGMYRLEEFYSQSKKTRVERELVKLDTTPHTLFEDGTEVIKRWEQKPDGKPKIRTVNKTVYAYYPKVRKDGKAIELFIMAGGDVSKTANELLYSGISAIIIAQILEKARIKTRISLLHGTSPDQYGNSFYGSIIPIKNYDENVDVNLLALITSDPRFFRWDGFKGILAVYDFFKKSMPGNFGFILTKENMKKVIEESDFAVKNNLPPNRFYFGGTYSESEATKVINETIEEIAERLYG
jgi:hypothetical protein